MNKCVIFLFSLVVLSVMFGAKPRHLEAAEAKVIPSFNNGVGKVFHNKCASCHRPGQSGPFSLLTYEDVVGRADTILAVIQDGYMPPWKLVNDNLSFSHDRRLTDSESQLVKDWVEGGTPLGDPNIVIELPVFPKDWQLGEPDLIVEMEGSFAVPESGRDVYRSFLFKLKLPEDKWVKAIEIKPQARSTLHHALFFVDTSGEARRRDGQDGKAGFSGMSFTSQLTSIVGRGQGARSSTQGLGGYVPGTTPTELPGDLAMLLPKNSDIVMQTHFHPSGKPEVEHATLALYLADLPPARLITNLQMPPLFGRFKGINVSAGDNHYEISDSFVLPVDAEGVVISGHAHYLCKEMEMIAKMPKGESITLMKIDDWDLDWQDSYQFAKSVDLPSGTELNVRIVYDNSANNPRNPFDPPEPISWGLESTDEMGSITLRVVPKNVEDHAKLQSGYRAYLLRSVANYRRRANGGRSTPALMLFRAMDKNRDGKILPEELPTRLRIRFDEFDSDSSGDLASQEFVNAAAILRGAR